MLYAVAMTGLLKTFVYVGVGAGGAWLLDVLGVPLGAVAGVAGLVGFVYLDNKMDDIRYRLAKLELGRDD